jgi:hypothetical protein
MSAKALTTGSALDTLDLVSMSESKIGINVILGYTMSRTSEAATSAGHTSSAISSSIYSGSAIICSSAVMPLQERSRRAREKSATPRVSTPTQPAVTVELIAAERAAAERVAAERAAAERVAAERVAAERVAAPQSDLPDFKGYHPQNDGDTSVESLERMVKTNPLAEILSDELYGMLRSNDLLNEKALRDFSIRSIYKKLKAKGMSTVDVISLLKENYPYLQIDTLRKIVYRVNPTCVRKPML